MKIKINNFQRKLFKSKGNQSRENSNQVIKNRDEEDLKNDDYRNVFREIGESINVIILKMTLFLEIGVLEKEWLYRNVFYIGMYFGRLIAFWEIGKLEKV